MDVFIYFPPGMTTTLDTVEDALDQALDGSGEVVGSGTGEDGSNLDVELDDDGSVATIVAVLRDLGVPAGTYLKVDGERTDVHPA